MSYELILTAPGGSSHRDLTRLVSSVTWSGSVKQVARQLKATVAVPKDGSVTPPDFADGSYLTLRIDGRAVFTGPMVSATTDSASVLCDLSALDNGRFLMHSKGFYKVFGMTAEQVAAEICSDYGIPVASLAAAGGRLIRKFPGVALDRIIRTVYNLRSAENGKHYLTRFTGDGALEVIEKPTTASLSIEQTMGVVNTWDITSLCNAVIIINEYGVEARRVTDGSSIARNGLLTHVIQEKEGEDVSAEAAAWLRDNALTQTLTVETLGDPRLISGNAVILKDTGSGVSGLFWIDGDTHTFKNNQYYTKVTLNFRNLMDSTMAGQEVK